MASPPPPIKLWRASDSYLNIAPCAPKQPANILGIRRALSTPSTAVYGLDEAHVQSLNDSECLDLYSTLRLRGWTDPTRTSLGVEVRVRGRNPVSRSSSLSAGRRSSPAASALRKSSDDASALSSHDEKSVHSREPLLQEHHIAASNPHPKEPWPSTRSFANHRDDYPGFDVSVKPADSISSTAKVMLRERRAKTKAGERKRSRFLSSFVPTRWLSKGYRKAVGMEDWDFGSASSQPITARVAASESTSCSPCSRPIDRGVISPVVRMMRRYAAALEKDSQTGDPGTIREGRTVSASENPPRADLEHWSPGSVSRRESYRRRRSSAKEGKKVDRSLATPQDNGGGELKTLVAHASSPGQVSACSSVEGSPNASVAAVCGCDFGCRQQQARRRMSSQPIEPYAGPEEAIPTYPISAAAMAAAASLAQPPHLVDGSGHASKVVKGTSSDSSRHSSLSSSPPAGNVEPRPRFDSHVTKDTIEMIEKADTCGDNATADQDKEQVMSQRRRGTSAISVPFRRLSKLLHRARTSSDTSKSSASSSSADSLCAHNPQDSPPSPPEFQPFADHNLASVPLRRVLIGPDFGEAGPSDFLSEREQARMWQRRIAASRARL